MKKVLTSLFVCLILGGCALYDSGYNVYKRPGIIVKDKAITYDYKYGICGNEIGILKGGIGDTVQLEGYRYRVPGPNVYSISNLKDTVFVSMEYVKSVRDYNISKTYPKFSVTKDKDEITWSRANKYVSDHAGMKIQIQSAYLIETYNSSTGRLTFSITRQVLGETIEFDVNSNSYEDAKRCAYYMINGD